MTEEVKTVRDPLLVITAHGCLRWVRTLRLTIRPRLTLVRLNFGAAAGASKKPPTSASWITALQEVTLRGPRACRKPLTKWTQTSFCVFGAATGRQGSFQKLTGRERARAAPRLWV